MARVGMLLLAAGLLEVYDGFRRARDADARAAWYNGASTLLIGIVVLNSTTIVAGVVIGLLAAWFLFDAGRYGWRAWRRSSRDAPAAAGLAAAAASATLAVAIVILVLRERVLPLTIAITAFAAHPRLCVERAGLAQCSPPMTPATRPWSISVSATAPRCW